MTRGPIPRFDLYEELEVSRLASAEVIEAAYRTLVKRHHPDVGGGADAERIKRLNVAHGWLTSPALRARYDETTATQTAPDAAKKVPVENEPTPDLAPGGFGPNSTEVRQFLADLRPLDLARAREMQAAKATIGTTEYAEARGVALTASRTKGRHDAWLFAREAAMVIARGKLDDAALAAEVAAIVADVAGAMVVRDLLPLADYQTLLTPWTWRPEVAEGAKAGVRSAPLTGIRLAGGTAAPGGRRPIAAGVAATAIFAVLGVAVLGGVLPRPAPEPSALTGALPGTASPVTGLASPTAAAPSPGGATPLASAAETPATPGATQIVAGVTFGPSFDPTAGPTPRPSAAPTPRPTPRPTLQPTAPPTPIPTPVPTLAPTPSPTPKVICTVPQLVGENSANVAALWTGASFTGTITYAPVTPPQYKIAWQSLTAGTDVLCTSDITVQQLAP